LGSGSSASPIDKEISYSFCSSERERKFEKTNANLKGKNLYRHRPMQANDQHLYNLISQEPFQTNINTLVLANIIGIKRSQITDEHQDKQKKNFRCLH
jgi:hypothetical protein